MKTNPTLRICVATSCSAVTEPRAPRHAAALARLSADCEVTFIDAYPRGDVGSHRHAVDATAGVRRESYRFPTRRQGALDWLTEKAWHRAAEQMASRWGVAAPAALSPYARALAAHVDAVDADVYFGHCADMLLPVWRAARCRNAVAIFDCMELYAEMGDGQTPRQTLITARWESELLPRFDLVTTTSPRLSEELVRRYGALNVLPLYNAAPRHTGRLPEKERGFTLYWRNSTIGFGQRGLSDILEALQLLPKDVVLHLQGRLPESNGRSLREYLGANGLDRRVVVHAPCGPDEAVRAASRFHVGLCAERPEVANHWYTVSNKLFDYHMAGLAVVASGLPSLRDVVAESGAGLLYRPGDPRDLAEKVMELYRDPLLRQRCANSGRRFALNTANAEQQMTRLRAAVRAILERRAPEAGWRWAAEPEADEVRPCVGY